MALIYAEVTVIIMPALSYDLVTLADLKTLLGVTATTDDAYYTRVIKQASREVAQYCNRVFAVETLKTIFYPVRDGLPNVLASGVGVLQLPRYPVPSIVSVTETIAGVATPLVEGTDVLTVADKGQLIRLGPDGYPQAWSANPVTVQYQAGFSPIPDDIIGAVVKLVRAASFERNRDPMLKAEAIPGIYSASYQTGAVGAGGAITSLIADDLSSYRVPVFA